MVLELSGELDLAEAPRLAGEIEWATGGERASLVLDLEALEFLDSAGLRAILAAYESARTRGEGFAVTPGTPQIQRLLTIAGVNGHLPTIDSADAALPDGREGLQTS